MDGQYAVTLDLSLETMMSVLRSVEATENNKEGKDTRRSTNAQPLRRECFDTHGHTQPQSVDGWIHQKFILRTL